ncbi:MAG: hypothetical protein FIA92_00030 [Chloroflexi bacterium]|nr:hypothetical protein [Chloroflexota bacterium]
MLPDEWTPSADDTEFEVDLRGGSDLPARVTGIRTPGQDRIDPGEYRFVVIVTRSPDNLPRTVSASVGCSAEVTIPPLTGTVIVDVGFSYSRADCTITVALDAPR